jgi:hypothetical protein
MKNLHKISGTIIPILLESTEKENSKILSDPYIGVYYKYYHYYWPKNKKWDGMKICKSYFKLIVRDIIENYTKMYQYSEKRGKEWISKNEKKIFYLFAFILQL